MVAKLCLSEKPSQGKIWLVDKDMTKKKYVKVTYISQLASQDSPVLRGVRGGEFFFVATYPFPGYLLIINSNRSSSQLKILEFQAHLDGKGQLAQEVPKGKLTFRKI